MDVCLGMESSHALTVSGESSLRASAETLAGCGAGSCAFGGSSVFGTAGGASVFGIAGVIGFVFSPMSSMA